MSEVADPPEIQVRGAVGSSRATACGTLATNWSILTDADMAVRHEGAGPAPLTGTAVQHDRSRLGDRNRAAGEHGGDPVEVRGSKVGPIGGGQAGRQIVKPA